MKKSKAKPVKTLSLRNAKGLYQVASLRRDNYERKDFRILTDGTTVWLTKQALGHPVEADIQIPKAIFDRLIDNYGKPQRVVRP